MPAYALPEEEFLGTRAAATQCQQSISAGTDGHMNGTQVRVLSLRLSLRLSLSL